MSNRNLLVAVFIEPMLAQSFCMSEWDLLIRQARCAGVLARLGYVLEKNELLGYVPDPAWAHIYSAQLVVRQFIKALNLEVSSICKALSSLNYPWVFLKGSAYVLAGNIAAEGRIFADIDILVSKDELYTAESLLRCNGWSRNNISEYDLKYYKEWMHELPPMHHSIRGTSLDLHHNILPITCKFCPDANKLLANSVFIPDKNLWILSQEDRILHSAIHLFHEGELQHGFRDLTDLSLLLNEFSYEEDFWTKLLKRSEELNQSTSLYYALRYTAKILHTQVPNDLFIVSNKSFFNGIKERLMDFLYLRALMPDHPSCDDFWTGFARWIIYIRSHWLRMPWYLLLPHLSRKAWMRISGKELH